MKGIIEALSKPPFEKSFNIISFDNLEPLQLLQVLNDVFTYIEPKVGKTKKQLDYRTIYIVLER